MIKINKLIKVYKGQEIETEVLKGISLEINKSEFISIMGKSGCGKTTLLNILGCMDGFNEGEYLFEGINIKQLHGKKLARFRNKKIGFVFQAFNLINELTALENIEVPLGYAGIPTKQRKEIAFDILTKVGMSNKAKNLPAQLSGGQQQRIAIARALANNPDIILADEPTGNLDSRNGIEIMELLQSLNKTGTTLIIVTHDDVLASYAKRKIELDDGKIIKDILESGVN